MLATDAGLNVVDAGPHLDVSALASGWCSDLGIATDGSLTGAAVRVVDLDTVSEASDDDLLAAAEAARAALPLMVGVSTGPIPSRAADLVNALIVTMSPVQAGREVVAVDDPIAAVARMRATAATSPRAAVAFGQVLRQTAQLDVRRGLAAEAAAYSMLLAGPEFRAWLRERGASRTRGTQGDPVTAARDGDVLRIQLTRPDRRNAFSADMRDALVEALTVALADPALSVELSGIGAGFSAGGDLDEFGSTPDVGLAYLLRLERHPGWLLHRLGQRVSVRLHGACIGAGIEMPSLAHRVVATRDARFGLPEVQMGVIPGAGGTVGIPRRIGRWRTAWLALAGEQLDAKVALDWGLVDELID